MEKMEWRHGLELAITGNLADGYRATLTTAEEADEDRHEVAYYRMVSQLREALEYQGKFRMVGRPAHVSVDFATSAVEPIAD